MVIQRWQSVLLLLAALLMGCFSFMSLGQVQLTDYSLDFTPLGFSIEGESVNGAPSGYVAHTWIFFVVSLMSALIPAITIFLYRNLSLQKTLCLIEILFLVAVTAIGAGYGYYSFAPASVSWSSLIIAPLLAFFLVVLAYNRINSDRKKINSFERLR